MGLIWCQAPFGYAISLSLGELLWGSRGIAFHSGVIYSAFLSLFHLFVLVLFIYVWSLDCSLFICWLACLLMCLFCLFFIHLSVYFYLFFKSVNLFIFAFTYLPIIYFFMYQIACCQFIHSFICLPIVNVFTIHSFNFIYLYISVFIYSFIYSFIYLLIHLLIHPFIYLSVVL